jgi:tetratricopeptide (TPR) repeat protein
VSKSAKQARHSKIQCEAEGYLELGLARQALGSLARLGDPTGFDPHSLYLWGEALRSLGRYEEALVPLGQGAAADPDNINIWVALAWCYKRTGHLELAIESLESALTAEPAEALLHYNLACYWSLAGDKERTLQYLSQSLGMDPRYRQLVADESDFDPFREDPDFRRICQGKPVRDAHRGAAE